MLKGMHYEISKENLAMHELIGLDVEVVESTDQSRKGIKGKVVDETKNVLVVECKNGEKKLPKKEVVLEFNLGDEKVRIEGKKLVARPHERTKIAGGKKHG